MASGVPIVSTDVGGIPYLVEDGVSALLVPSGDAQAMASGALRILDDPALGARLARAGLEASRGYAWAQVRSDLFAVYARAGQGNARTSARA
jgi:glycosyltransferase involved in cell wall biosynthesis